MKIKKIIFEKFRFDKKSCESFFLFSEKVLKMKIQIFQNFEICRKLIFQKSEILKLSKKLKQKSNFDCIFVIILEL